MFTNPVLTCPYNQALITVAHKLNELGVKWRLFASGAFYVWGVKVVPKDIDIFVTKEDILHLEKNFADYLTRPLHSFNEKGRECLEFQIRISNVEIEICEIENLGKNVPLDFHGETVWVAPLEAERDEYFRNSPFKDRLPLIDVRLKEIKAKQHTI